NAAGVGAAPRRARRIDRNDDAGKMRRVGDTASLDQYRSPDEAKRNPGQPCTRLKVPAFRFAPCGLHAAACAPPRTLSHSCSARARACESCGGEETEPFTARTRAPLSSGKVTMEISHS